MNDSKYFKVWCIKYAGGSGVSICNVVDCGPEYNGMLRTDKGDFLHKKEYALTKSDALEKIRERFAKKRASLRQQLLALEGKEKLALEFIERIQI